ncbi:MAG: hypothetical protein ACLPSW_08495 [Roseiarcus sp.]
MKQALLWISAGFAIASAILWLVACFRKIEYDPKDSEQVSGDPPPVPEWVVRDGKRKIDILKTAQARTFWSSLAAFSAALAALADAAMLIV